MRVLHITEALGGGVAHSVSQLARVQAANGFDVVVAHSIRPDTPRQEQLEALFPPPIRRLALPMVTPVSPFADLAAAGKIFRLIREIAPDAIHLHSSKAGVLGRIAARLAGAEGKVFYSPRGFSFLRQDVSRTKRWLYLFFEVVAARLGGTLVACSNTEGIFARKKAFHPHVVVVENAVDVESIPPVRMESGNAARIVTSGRVCYPKAPWRFRELARMLKDEVAEFVWIGAGELEAELAFPDSERMKIGITGWLARDDVIQELVRSDIYVQSSLWEGMPLSLIEAQVAGLPAVVIDVVGCRDVVIDGVTGYVCKDVAEMKEKILCLLNNPELRGEMGGKARELGLTRFSTRRMHDEMARVYRGDAIPIAAMESSTNRNSR